MTDQAVPDSDVVTAEDLPRPARPIDPSTPARHEFMFPSLLRKVMIGWVVVTVPVIAAVMWQPRDPVPYLRQMIVITLLFAGPGFVLAAIAAVRAPERDRTARWLWASAMGFGVVGAVSSLPRVQVGMDPPVLRTTVPVIATLVVLTVANTLIMRSRSGHRAALVDATDLLMATIALLAPLGLAFAPAIIDSSRPWFTVAAALWVVVAVHGTMVALMVRARLQPGYRTMADIGVAFGLLVAISSAGSVILGVNDFELPTGPFAGLYMASLGVGMLFFVYMPRHTSPGLERLPTSAQARRNSLIAMVVLISVPVTAAVVWARRDHDWIPIAGLLTVLALLSMSSLRHLLAARETNRLYAMVERSSHERGELLAEVMSHVDTDRHRAAAHLHRQAASLYTAMASFTSALNQAADNGNPAAVSFAAERLRRDLGQRADGLRQLAEAVKPIAPTGEEARRLAAPMRAYLENLAGDGPRPDLQIDVDPELVLDWTTEAAVLRIVQEATLRAWWHGCAATVHVSVTAASDGVHVDVVDDGRGSSLPHHYVGATMGSLARILGGELTTTPLPDGGTRVMALIPFAMSIPSEPRTPHLRLVDQRRTELSSTDGPPRRGY